MTQLLLTFEAVFMDDPINAPSDLDSLPELVKDLPAKATKIIVRLMDWEDNWFKFAQEIWPKYSLIGIESRFKQKKTEAILSKWGKKEATTVQLFDIIKKLNRKDIIEELQEKFPSWQAVLEK
jgi:hypothetical protein